MPGSRCCWSASPRRRRSSTRTTSRCAPGQSARVDGYTIRYVRPIAHASAAKISFGAVLDVSKNGQPRHDADDLARVLPGAADPTVGPISEAFNGQSDSNVGLRAGLTRDIWTVINSNLQPLQAKINEGDRLFEKLMTSLTPAQARQPANVCRRSESERAQAIFGLTSQFVKPSLAGRVPADRLAAGDLDLARRDHHRLRRSDRAVARAGARAAPGDRADAAALARRAVPAREPA